MKYDLEVKHGSQESFYGKAVVRSLGGNRITLTSYSTDVAYIEDDKAVVNGTYSATTLKHIKEFLLQHGFEASSKKQIEKDYMKGGK